MSGGQGGIYNDVKNVDTKRCYVGNQLILVLLISRNIFQNLF